MEPGLGRMINNKMNTVLAWQETESQNKLLHAKALLTKERQLVTVLVDIESSSNMLQKGYCCKRGLVIQSCKK